MTTTYDDDREWGQSGYWAKKLGVTTGAIRWNAKAGKMDRRMGPRGYPEYAPVDAAAPEFEDKTDPELFIDVDLSSHDDDDDLNDYRHVADDPRSAIEDIEPIEELIARRVETFRRASALDRHRRAIVRIERDGPFAVCHMGDPHVDDDGCDWDELLRDVETVNRTPHMYAGNVGDTVNNWVGKLIGKWKQQSTTEDEAFRLGQWLFGAVPWDYVLLGNHDHWNQGGTIFRQFAEDSDVSALADHEARIEYVGVGGGRFRLDVRHDFKGGSMWNNVHGPLKRAKMRPWGDLLVCGHKHTWGIHAEETQPGRPTWLARVRGYKRMDEYAEAKDFAEDAHGCSMTSVIDPNNANRCERMKMFHDVGAAADYLTWLRGRSHG